MSLDHKNHQEVKVTSPKPFGPNNINDKRAWIYVTARTRARLNMYKAIAGIVDDGILDQDAALQSLLDKAGAPTLETGARIIGATEA